MTGSDRRRGDDEDFGVRPIAGAMLEVADRLDRADVELRKAYEPTIAEAQAAIKAHEHERAAKLFESIAGAYRDRFRIHHQVDYWLTRAADCRAAAKLFAKTRQGKARRRR